jgi:predicted transglutaminase-like cysteine proteinase
VRAGLRAYIRMGSEIGEIMERWRGLGRNAALLAFSVIVVAASILSGAPARALPIAKAPVYPIDDYPFQNAPALKQWRSVMAREAHLTGTADPDACNDGQPRLACAAKEAALLEETLRDLAPAEQVAGVYAYFNAVKYKEHDPANCGVDCWKSRLQFLAQREGDCGDHALAEYFTLKRLGFKERDLQLIVAQMPGFEDSFKGGHVVLRVRTDDAYYILDNRRTGLADLSGLRKYKILAGMNAESVQIYNLVTDIPPPGFIADSGKAAQLLASPGGSQQAAPVLVAETRTAEAPTQVAAATASAPEESEAEDESSAICTQSARLGDWNPFLPCTAVNTVKMVVKAKTIIGATPPASTAKPVKVAAPVKTPAPAVIQPKALASLTALPATKPKFAPKAVAEATEADDGDAACIQGARLADWNPNLPCTPGGTASRITIQMKDDTPEM